MGTRSRISVILGDETKSYYNQFDGYFSGVGQEILDFSIRMNKENGWEKFKENLKAVELVKTEDKPTPEQCEKYKELKFYDSDVDMPFSDGTPTWYQLLRHTQGAVALHKIYEGTMTHMLDGEIYGQQEYNYSLDLNNMVFLAHVSYSGKITTLPLNVEVKADTNPDYSQAKIDAILMITEDRFEDAEMFIRNTLSQLKSFMVPAEYENFGQESE